MGEEMIPREQIDEILEKNDIVDVISEYVDLKRRGSSFLGRCPFHSEKTPSFSVSREKNIFHCFGCHEHGNVIGFVMKYENVSFVEAVKILADRVGITLTDEKRPYNDIKDKLREINRLAGIYYYRKLRSEEGREAYKYLRDRNLSNDTMNKFGIGYAPKSNNNLYKYFKDKDYTDDILKKSGLFSFYNGQFVDKFYNRVIFPIFDVNGKVVAFGGRTLDGKGAKYLNSPETEIFHKKNIIYGLNFAKKSRAKYMVLCEGYMDVIAMQQAGFDMAVATMGTAFNISHALEIKKYTKNVFMLYDSDEAGQSATEKAAKILVDNEISVKVIDISPYKDPDECIQKVGREFILESIQKAEAEVYFRINRAKNRYDLFDPTSKLRFIEEAGKIIANYSDDYIKAAYKDIASHFFIDHELLLKNIQSAKIGEEYNIEKNQNILRKRKKDRVSGDKLDKIILWLLFRNNIYKEIRHLVKDEYFIENKYVDILSHIDEEYKKNREIEEYKLLTWFEDEKDIEILSYIYHCNDDALKLSERDFQTMVRQTVSKFIEESFNRKIKEELDFTKIPSLINEKDKKVNEAENISLRLVE